MILRDPQSSHPAVRSLRERLDAFYANPPTYPVFEASVNRDAEYEQIFRLIQASFQPADRPIRVLELGAGRSDLPNYVRRRGLNVEYDAQDVTSANADYLRPLVHHFHLGDISEIRGLYDLILSTYVFEHVSAPREFLEHVSRLLAPGGWHMLICPRYDVPGYLCPSLRHVGWLARHVLMCRLAGTRFMSLLDGRPRFLVNTDPAVFHGPWRVDVDAVHLVSQFDVSRWHRCNGFSEVRRLRRDGTGLLGRLRFSLLTTALACRKEP